MGKVKEHFVQCQIEPSPPGSHSGGLNFNFQQGLTQFGAVLRGLVQQKGHHFPSQSLVKAWLVKCAIQADWSINRLTGFVTLSQSTLPTSSSCSIILQIGFPLHDPFGTTFLSDGFSRIYSAKLSFLSLNRTRMWAWSQKTGRCLEKVNNLSGW